MESFEGINSIYHYTDVGGLKGILESHKLWISHSYFMNDTSEILYTYHLLKGILEKTKEAETDICNINFYKLYLDQSIVL